MESEKFCLRWNDFKSSISEAFQDLREEKDFFDVTLACEDNQIQAHKVILSACSPFFRNILRRNPHQHPLLYLKDVKYKELLSIINFMYMGEVSVAQDELNSFLNVAEELRVKGLTQSINENAEPDFPPKKEHRAKDPWKKSSDLQIPSSSNHTHSISTRQAPQIQRNQTAAIVQDVVPIKSEPREPLQQRPPVRSYHDQAQVMYDHEQHAEQEHEPVHDELIGQDIDQGTVAIDDTYVDDYQYDDPDYEATGENVAYAEQPWPSKGTNFFQLS